MPRSSSRPPPRPARQVRSLRTQERILAAMESLLADPAGEDITMDRLAERAHVSIGAIYKRFSGKDSLLPLVLERVHEQQFAALRDFLARRSSQDIGLSARIEQLLHLFADNQQARARLIRSLLVGHWQSDDRAPMEARSAELIGLMHAWLSECEAEIRHPDPRLALSLGLFTTLQTLQSAILFERVPAALGIAGFVDEMARMFQRYLGLAVAPEKETDQGQSAAEHVSARPSGTR